MLKNRPVLLMINPPYRYDYQINKFLFVYLCSKICGQVLPLQSFTNITRQSGSGSCNLARADICNQLLIIILESRINPGVVPADIQIGYKCAGRRPPRPVMIEVQFNIIILNSPGFCSLQHSERIKYQNRCRILRMLYPPA